MSMNTEVTDTPYGRVHQAQNGKHTGLPMRYLGARQPPPPAAMNSDIDSRAWAPTSWDDMTPSEQRDYKRQYPVV